MSARKTITVIVDERTFELFERYCAARGHKKSTLAAKLIKDHLAQEAFSYQEELTPKLEPQEKSKQNSRSRRTSRV